MFYLKISHLPATAFYILLCAFASVAVPAEHLTVVGHSPSALLPRGDVVGLHLADVKDFPLARAIRVGAMPALPLVNLPLGVVVKGPDVKMTLVAIEDV